MTFLKTKINFYSINYLIFFFLIGSNSLSSSLEMFIFIVVDVNFSVFFIRS